jgi:hypothetical protein
MDFAGKESLTQAKEESVSCCRTPGAVITNMVQSSLMYVTDIGEGGAV